MSRQQRNRRRGDGFGCGPAAQVRAEYFHRSGDASAHVYWSGPGFPLEVLRLDGGGAAAAGGGAE